MPRVRFIRIATLATKSLLVGYDDQPVQEQTKERPGNVMRCLAWPCLPSHARMSVAIMARKHEPRQVRGGRQPDHSRITARGYARFTLPKDRSPRQSALPTPLRQISTQRDRPFGVPCSGSKRANTGDAGRIWPLPTVCPGSSCLIESCRIMMNGTGTFSRHSPCEVWYSAWNET